MNKLFKICSTAFCLALVAGAVSFASSNNTVAVKADDSVTYTEVTNVEAGKDYYFGVYKDGVAHFLNSTSLNDMDLIPLGTSDFQTVQFVEASGGYRIKIGTKYLYSDDSGNMKIQSSGTIYTYCTDEGNYKNTIQKTYTSDYGNGYRYLGCNGTYTAAKFYLSSVISMYAGVHLYEEGSSEGGGEVTPVYTISDFADEFLSTVTCDGGKTAPSKTAWNAMADKFYTLSDDDKATLRSTTGNEFGTNVQHCVRRYDVIISAYGNYNYTNFMGRDVITSRSAFISSLFTENTSMNYVIIISIGAAAVSAIAGIAIAKKRKAR